ncbi:MAG: cysteine--tRNA ligase [Caldiserica bacterium]|nr:cysteine--tRNA ligase [Caldisericota bacterium]
MKVFTTLGREKKEFVPQEAGKVKMYVCGVTLYDECHLGHGRAYVAFDVMRRFLESRGYKVIYVQNFTDIDDKIIKKSQEEAKEEKEIPGKIKEIVARYKEAYFRVMDQLNIKRADIYPCATDHVSCMIEMVGKLVEKGFAYEKGGDVFFSVEKFPSYGKLSGKNLEELLPGARVGKDEKKKNPLDFVLWKSAKPYEPSWDSPWGKGRPGWHIECSVMSMEYLGETLDIHGGGEDLIFPHHENEIAQSESYTGRPFARYWIHNGFVKISGEKMSKSLKNFFLLRELLEEFDPRVLRLYLISTHYRNPLDFQIENIKSVANSWQRIEEACLKAEEMLGGEKVEKLPATLYFKNFQQAMEDDFNTPRALGALFDLVGELNRRLSRGEKDAETFSLYGDLKEMLDILGFPLPQREHLSPELEKLIQQREEARKNKNWAEADRIREILKSKGILLKDTPQGTVWRRF